MRAIARSHNGQQIKASGKLWGIPDLNIVVPSNFPQKLGQFMSMNDALADSLMPNKESLEVKRQELAFFCNVI